MQLAPRYSFRLYVSQESALSLLAQANLRALCEAAVPGDYSIEVIDVYERPDMAEQDRILATPTVVRLEPAPRWRVMGDLSDHRLAALALDLPALAGPDSDSAQP